VVLYSRHIFPRILDWSLGVTPVQQLRSKALAEARGQVLEVGFGTGLNLRHYPPQVEAIVAIDSERMLPERVARRIAQSGLKVTPVKLDASGVLPFADASFDSVVTTFTLCSIRDVAEALEGIRRVLKPEGNYIFLEHGRSDDPRVARRQDLLNPLQKIIAVGCNINRPIDRIIRQAGLTITGLDRFVMPQTPRVLGEMYVGTARRG
jgi:ubiquinone/menaquinone biosynthesis C-methylase UbiE